MIKLSCVVSVAQFQPWADQPLAGVRPYRMYCIYVLKSNRNGKRYVGYSSKTAEIRLKEHNQGSNRWTSQNGLFKLIRKENYENKTEAIKREIFLKSGAGRAFLDNIEKQ